MTVAAGARILASDIQAIQRIYARKTSNQSVTSSTTLTNDSQLVIPVLANNAYDFELKCFYNGAASGTGDLIVGFSIPSGASGLVEVAGFNLSLTFQYGYRTIPITALAYGTNTTSNNEVCRLNGTIIVGSTGGSLQFQWAQNTSNATATTVLAGSTLIGTNVT